MGEEERLDLTGRKILIVEDEFMVAVAIRRELEDYGATVIGFCSDVQASMACLAAEPDIDIAIVDLNLGGVPSTPVIDLLLDRGVPTILCTGYEDWSMEERLRALPRCEKPFTRSAISRQLKALPLLRPRD